MRVQLVRSVHAMAGTMLPVVAVIVAVFPDDTLVITECRSYSNNNYQSMHAVIVAVFPDDTVVITECGSYNNNNYNYHSMHPNIPTNRVAMVAQRAKHFHHDSSKLLGGGGRCNE